MMLICYIFIPTTEAISPYFARQDIADDVNDLVKLDYSNYSITRVNNSDASEKKIADSIDMDYVTYLSDGKNSQCYFVVDTGI